MGSSKLTKELSVGIHVPSVSATVLDPVQAYVEFFRHCEAGDFDALWTEDRILHEAHLADPLLLLALAAGCTERLLLGTAVLMLNLRQAVVAARQISTLNHLSRGRVVLGVSVGGHPGEYEALGVPMKRRVSVLRESLAVMRGLLRGEPFDYHGSEFQLENAVVRPAADVPILMGGAVEAAIRRAGQLADGWVMSPFGTLDDFASGWATLRDAAVKAGRDPEVLVAGRLSYVAVDENRARARESLRTFLHGYYGERFDVDRHAIFGPPGEVAARLREQVDAGISHLMLGVPSLDVEHLQRIASEVLPTLRR